jgi:cytochrome c-type biogenesis protein CcmH/NrfG
VLAETQYRAAKQHFAEMAYYDAITSAREAIRLAAGKGHYHRLLAQALAKNPKWTKQAEEHFRKAIELDRFDVESRLGLAELYEETGLTARAKRTYEEVLEFDAENAIAREKVGKKASDTGASFGRLRHLAKLLSRDDKKE